MKPRVDSRGGVQTTKQTQYTPAQTDPSFDLHGPSSVTTYGSNLIYGAITETLVCYEAQGKGDFVSTNPWMFTKERHECYTGTRHQQSEDEGFISSEYWIFGTVDQVSPSFTVLPSDLSYNRALAALYEKLRGQIDLSIAVAESGKTMKMTKQALTLAKYITGFHPKHWAKHWLEYQYGWRPLVQDLYNTGKELMAQTVRSMRLEEKATRRDAYSTTQSTSTQFIIREIVQSQRTHIGVIYTPSSSAMTTMSRYTSLNPASIAWELTPFSFVVDWFIDIGGFLRSFESAITLASGSAQGFVTRTSLNQVNESVTGNGLLRQGSRDLSSYRGFSSMRSFNRVAITALPLPRAPKFKVSLGTSRLVSTAALLQQFIQLEKAPPKKRRLTQLAIQRRLQRWANEPRKRFPIGAR